LHPLSVFAILKSTKYFLFFCNFAQVHMLFIRFIEYFIF